MTEKIGCGGKIRASTTDPAKSPKMEDIQCFPTTCCLASIVDRPSPFLQVELSGGMIKGPASRQGRLFFLSGIEGTCFLRARTESGPEGDSADNDIGQQCNVFRQREEC